MFHAKLIIQRQPCTACVIINSLNQETLQKVANMREDFVFEVIIIDNPKELVNFEGVEVEKMPVTLIDDEQVSAGRIISPRMINEILTTF